LDKKQFKQNIDHWTYARRSHWDHFKGLDVALYGEKVDIDNTPIKSYQDLLIMMMINEFIPNGGRLLEVGGVSSRILRHFSESHECWNIDKFEGLGDGPTKLEGRIYPFKVIQDYMGNFNEELPENYFDLVFSISALEHVEDENHYIPICDDIDRVLKVGGMSAHLLDVVFYFGGGFWTNKIIYTMFNKPTTLNKFSAPEELSDDQDLYYMSEATYLKFWLRFTNKTYKEHGRPSSMNIFWVK